MKRKVIQISMAHTGVMYNGTLIALCNDGTLWESYSCYDDHSSTGVFKWREVDNVPQPEEVEEDEEETWRHLTLDPSHPLPVLGWGRYEGSIKGNVLAVCGHNFHILAGIGEIDNPVQVRYDKHTIWIKD